MKNTANVDQNTWPRPGIYKHFKGNTYHVLGVSMDSNAPDAHYVVYTPQYGEYAGLLAHRSLGMFLEDVDRPSENYKGPRFRCIEPRDFLKDFRCRQSPTGTYHVIGISQNTETHSLSIVIQRHGSSLQHYDLETLLP